MWDLPGPGLEPVSPALAGGFFTTAPPGKPERAILEATIVTVPLVSWNWFLASMFTVTQGKGVLFIVNIADLEQDILPADVV